MEVDRARTAELKDALHRNCGPTILVLPTVQVPSRPPPCRWPPRALGTKHQKGGVSREPVVSRLPTARVRCAG